MTDFSLPVLAAWANAMIFAAAGVANFTAPKRIRTFYEQWDVTPGFYRTLGVIEIAAAVCLATPSLRVWGLVLAGPIAFGSVVMLLDQQKYIWAASAIAIVAGLFAAMLTLAQKPSFVVANPAESVVIQVANNSSRY